MSRDHRSGGKFCGSHTTGIPAALTLADIAAKLPEVNRILLGYIKAGLKPVGGQRRVKIVDEDGAVLLSVRDNIAHQEIRLYTSDHHTTKLAIARGARDVGLHIAFRKET